MKKQLLTFILIISNSYLLIAQPAIQWENSFGGTQEEIGSIIQQTYDGGYIVAGTSYSNDGDVSGNHGDTDYWIFKLDSSGVIQWQKCLGGFNYENTNYIQQTNDSGYIVAGQSGSNNGDVTGHHGSGDFWVVKLNKNGIIQWQKSLGGTGNEIFGGIRQTNDAGYICAVTSESNDGDVSGNHGTYDCWIVKLDSIGIIQWQKSMGGSGFDATSPIQQTNDAGYIVAGTSGSNDGDVTGNHGSNDYWIVKLDSNGIIQWQKSIGGSNEEEVHSIQPTNDAGYIVAGYSGSNDGDVTGNHGNYDSWIVKLDSIGVIQWQKSMGGSGIDEANSIQPTNDAGYIVAGFSESSDGDLTSNQGNYDYWIVKLDSTGSIQWQKSFGGISRDAATNIQQTNDGGYICAGLSYSWNGDVTGNHGSSDYWIVKFSPVVNINEIQNPISDFQNKPNPFSLVTNISFQLSSSNKISLKISDIEGRLIKNISSKNFNIGFNEIVWDATNNSGGKVENGLYIITLVSDNFSETKKVVVLKN